MHFENLINQMGFYPNKMNTEKLFIFIKQNENDTLYFEEFIAFIEIVLCGTKEEKIKFIFNFINFPETKESLSY